MALPVSVGDVVALIDGTLKVYNRLKNAPKELTTARRDVEQMQTTMIVLKSKLDDKSSLLSKDQKM